MTPTDYPVLLVYSREDGAWLAQVDMLPGCMADGATPEEALSNVRMAIEDWIQVSKELNRTIPPPWDLQELEELQVQAMELHGQQVQQLIQQAVAQVISQYQSAMPSLARSSRTAGQGYQLPLPRVESLTSS